MMNLFVLKCPNFQPIFGFYIAILRSLSLCDIYLYIQATYLLDLYLLALAISMSFLFSPIIFIFFIQI